ncbi:MAG TPA: ABC transporter permease [Anaerolineaceae bacterium]|nr:ABC transporter permease [Anaerolineaceae bacterium]
MGSSIKRQMGRISDLLRFTFKDLVSDGWRTLITVTNLLVFLCCYFAMEAFAEAAYKFGNQPTDRSALLIVSRNVFDPSESLVTDEEFQPARELMPAYVKSVTPLMFKIIQANTSLLQLRAASLEDMQTVHSLSLVSGEWPTGGDDIVIGEGALSGTGWTVGSTVRIYGSDFRISGIVRAPGTKFSSIWMRLDQAENLFNLQGVYQFAWIQLQPTADAEAVRMQLQNDPRLADRFDVYFVDNLYQEYTKAVSDLKGLSSMLVLLALSAVMLGTYCNIFLILTERSREITILRAVGFQSGAIRGLIILRTLLQIAVAYLLAWGLTALLLNWFNRINPLSLHSIPLPVSISAFGLLLGAVLALIFGWVGVWLPTRHLRRRSVASFIQK